MADPKIVGKSNINKQQPTSLFLNPPLSGFPNFNQNPLLVPIATHAEVNNLLPANVPPGTSLPSATRESTAAFQTSFDSNYNSSRLDNTHSSSINFPQSFPSGITTSNNYDLSPSGSGFQSVDQPAQPSLYYSGQQSPFDSTATDSDYNKTAGRFSQMVYTPVHPHWMYCKQIEKKPVWVPFSLLDSLHLEEEYVSKNGSGNFSDVIVQTDGGRYDVYLKDQERHAVYWEENKTPVRRATWFYRPYGARLFIPYPETFADKLEEEYCVAVTTNTWHRRLEFPEGDTVVIHNPNVIVHYQASSPHEWEGVPEDQVKPTVVKRGMDDFEGIEDGEGLQIDHLVFVVHGIGATCDLKFRTLPEVVNDFRTISADLLKSHYRHHLEENRINRIEFLPASWHTFLHGEATGIDDKLKPITLTSIPKLRYFANDAILDVLFFTSPVYCQAIINQVCSEINRLYALFLSRNPTFHGKVSLAGHSLGSVILFDLLYHQSTKPDPPMGKSALQQLEDEQFEKEKVTTTTADLYETQELDHVETLSESLTHLGLESFIEIFENEKMDKESIMLCNDDDLKALGLPLGPRKKLLAYLIDQNEKLKREKLDKFTDIPKIESNSSYSEQGRRQSETTINYVVGLAGTGHPYIIYPRLDFEPTCFFALGSPIAMFLTVRGLDMHWEDFKLPTCPAFFNIFHPFDPVAYRIEPLLKPENYNLKPVMMLHHKGRKRMHLEIRESLTRVGADLKHRLFDSLKSTWNTINDFARAHSSSTFVSQAEEEAAVNEMVEEELRRHQNEVDDDVQSTISNQEVNEDFESLGVLNGGRRIDYVLQEKPIESFNEYLFALGSHTCYWESEDTVLLMLKEIYESYGIYPSSIPSEPPAPSTKAPVLYNPYEAQRYYAANPVPQNNLPNISGNPYRKSSLGQKLNQSTDQATYQNDLPQSSQGFHSQEPHRPTVLGIDPTNHPTASTVGHSLPGPPPLAGFVKQSAIRK